MRRRGALTLASLALLASACQPAEAPLPTGGSDDAGPAPPGVIAFKRCQMADPPQCSGLLWLLPDGSVLPAGSRLP